MILYKQFIWLFYRICCKYRSIIYTTKLT